MLMSGSIAVVATVLIAALLLSSAILASARARSAADLAALAGARQLIDGSGQHAACAVAARLAHLNGGTVTRCANRGEIIEVTVTVRPAQGVPGMARARARAGPGLVRPDAQSESGASAGCCELR